MVKQIENFNLRTIANSGQCFRIHEVDTDVFNVNSTNKFLRIVKIDNDKYDFKCNATEFAFYKKYFDLDSDYNKYIKVCKSNDSYLKKCIKYSSGLRILNQDRFEMVISFIISQRKSVKAIETSIERLCKLCGERCESEYGYYYAFPTAEEILGQKKTKLIECGLGYRLQYIVDFCRNFISGRFDLDALAKYDNEKLLDALMSIKGVGIKVASCIALFAYHRIDICPEDVWIKRVINNKYGGSLPKSYREYAGIIQQYWFNYSKNIKDV